MTEDQERITALEKLTEEHTAHLNGLFSASEKTAKALEQMHLRVETLEGQFKTLAKAYAQMAEANNFNGDVYFKVVDAIQSQIVSLQVLVELLGQEGIVNEKEFRKYQTTLSSMVKKRQLENLLEKEVEE